jgi:hypothetical protein
MRKTHRRRGKDQLVERAARPRQPALEGVARLSLLVILGVVANLEGGRPRDTGKLKGLGLTASDASW